LIDLLVGQRTKFDTVDRPNKRHSPHGPAGHCYDANGVVRPVALVLAANRPVGCNDVAGCDAATTTVDRTGRSPSTLVHGFVVGSDFGRCGGTVAGSMAVESRAAVPGDAWTLYAHDRHCG
jgi:hypothetical protein